MPHSVTFFPVGNADTCLIDLDNGRRIIFDYANTRDSEDQSDKRIDLEAAIREQVGSSKQVDVLAISHLDRDHYSGASKLFWFNHAHKYQSEERIKVKTLWVPAAAILEEGIEDEGGVIRAEARHRLKMGKGIRVFSVPRALDQWFHKNDIDPEDRRHLITHAGKLAPEFTLSRDGIEFFIHSPFAERCDNGELIVRNESALFVHATFQVEARQIRLILSADCTHELFEDIIRVTRHYGNDDRLRWDINNIPHHCSYLSLSSEKGVNKTTPSDSIRWLYEQQGDERCLLISTSNKIPSEETKQPPHRQAAAYYKDVANSLDGEFLVTMEEPKPHNPQPIQIDIGSSGYRIRKSIVSAPTIITTTKPPRAG